MQAPIVGPEDLQSVSQGIRKRYRVHGLRFRGLGLLKAAKVGRGGGEGTKGSCECMSRQVEAKTDRRKRMNIQQQPFIWVVVKIMVSFWYPKK